MAFRLATLLMFLSLTGQAFATTAAPPQYTSPLTCTRTFYVSPAGTDTATCGAGPLGAAANCATPWGADAATSIGATGTTLTGGDCVSVKGTTPTQTATGSSGWTAYNTTGLVTFTRSGTNNSASGYINYVCSVNHGCYHAMTTAAGSSVLKITGNFVAFDGFEFDGVNIQGYHGYAASNTNTYNTGGQQLVDNTGGHHHFWLNTIQHSAGGGILGESSQDYDYFIANEAYDGSGVNSCHTSQAGLYEPITVTPNGSFAWDNNVYKSQWIGNVIHDGGETAAEPQTVCAGQTTQHTDGNSLSLDDWAHTQSNNIQYTGKALIAYNLIYNTGGRGGLVFTSANSVWENNTFWNNCLDPQVISSRGCHDVEIGGYDQNGTAGTYINNITVRANGGDQGSLSIAGGDANNINNNLTFDAVTGSGQSIALGGINLGTVQAQNPLLGVNPKLTNMTGLDFHPLTGSPALGAGAPNPVTSQFAMVTPDGKVPPSPTNVGAFNQAGSVMGGGQPVSINVGGPAVAPNWIADCCFTMTHGGIANNNPTGAVDTSLVINPAPTAIYRTERWDNPFTYTVSNLVPNRVYSIRLHFSEDWPPNNFVGARVENIAINGTQVQANYDIFATAGAQNKATELHFAQAADVNGMIAITFTAVPGHQDANAKVDGVEVLLMPTATLTATPGTISAGQQSTLVWSSLNSTRCIGTGFSTGGATSGSLVVTPTVNTTYSLSCDAGGVAGTASQIVTVNPALSAVITANPMTVVSGGAVTLTWTSNATVKCVGTNFSTGNATNGTLVVNPTVNTTYSVACDSGGSPINSSTLVTVSAVTATLSPSPSTILNGQTSTLTWTSNGSRCIGTGFGTNNNPNGTAVVSPTSNTTYSIACDNGGASTPATTIVTVTPVTAVLSASPATINVGGSSTLTWSSNGTRCVGTGFSTGNAASGTLVVSPTITTSYSIACDAGGATTPANTIVMVNNTASSSIISSATAVASNSATISWSSVNAGSCVGTNFSTGGAPSGSVQVSPMFTTTYSVACGNAPLASVQVIVPVLNCTNGPPFSCTWAPDPPPVMTAAVASACQPGWTAIANGFCQMALTSTAAGNTWLSPSNWNNSNNTIEGIGAGGGHPAATLGGGGGEYCKISNFTVTTPGVTTVAYTVGAGASGAAGGSTTWNTSSLVAHGGSAGASGVAGAGGTGGTGTCNHGGAASGTSSGAGSAGGGGAAGPNGIGAVGGNNSSGGGGGGGGNGGGTAGSNSASNTGANGGNNSLGTGGGVGGASSFAGGIGTLGGGGGGAGLSGSAGGNGGSGNEWPLVSAGSGGGGGGGGVNGGGGGLYGGGTGSGAAAIAGAQGVIIVTYHP